MRHSAAAVSGRRANCTLSAVLTASLLAAAPAHLMASPAVTLSSSVAAPERVSLEFLRAPAAAPIGYSASLSPRLEIRKVQSASVLARPVAQSQSLDWAVSQRRPAAPSTTGQYQRGRYATATAALARPPASISLGRSDASYHPMGGVASLHEAAAPRSGNAAMAALHHANRREAVFSTASVIEPKAFHSQSPSHLNLSSEPRESAFPHSSPVGAIAIPGVGLR